MPKLMTSEAFTEQFLRHLKLQQDKTPQESSNQEVYEVIASMTQQNILPQWKKSADEQQKTQSKQIYYISMEFLIGSLLESNLLNNGWLEAANQSLQEMGISPERVYRQEHDAGLGNGGLGRLAACFLDSLASLGYRGHGFGIRYKYGLFEQRIIQGNQVELPDDWLRNSYPWEVRKEEEAVLIHFHGDVHMFEKQDGSLEFKHENTDQVKAVPYDIPIVGYHNGTVNTLRLWSAEIVNHASEQLYHDYYHELHHEHAMEQISGYLYPDDSTFEGQELRLKQQYFLVAASLKNIIQSFRATYQLPLSHLPEKAVVQLNDTHPTIAIPELMRILMDEENFSWEKAWETVTNVFAYTNHTTMPEAFEKWPVEMVQQLLPRIYMIIDEINERFCQFLWLDKEEFREHIPEMAIIADGQVHMAHLAIIGSFSVNGVASMHTAILKKYVMKHFNQLYPERFNNKTNGITHRRWLLQANPSLAALITETIGSTWIHQPEQLISLLKYTKDPSFQEKIEQSKLQNKRRLKQLIDEQTGITIDETSIFDVQVKRLHEYKRQVLKVFHILYLYNTLKKKPDMDIVPRTFIFGAKAAPGYHLAKEIVKLINKVATMVNHDTELQDKLKVIFMENYNVSTAEYIIPAADISEQISTAGKEASGTGNMKMMLNGALTVGTFDGANVEMKNQLGEENIFIFGLTAEEIQAYRENDDYEALELYHRDARLKEILDQLDNGFGSEDIAFKDLYYNLLYHNDPFFVLKDFAAYIEIQEYIEQVYRNRTEWLQKSIINTAQAGKFSSDQAVQHYATDIWKLPPT